MYKERFDRNYLYFDEEFQEILKNKYIAVIGLGGVGGYALEGIVRLGISNLLIADFDFVTISNINRQIIALNSTVGLKKTEVWKKRLFEINPEINLKICDNFIEEEDFSTLFDKKPDFIIDAIDTTKSKIMLIKYAKENNIPLISSFGAGNRIDASKLYVCDISELQYKDNFTKNLLSKLKKYANITSDLLVVASLEHPYNNKKVKNVETIKKQDGKIAQYTKFTPASNSIVPAVAGFLIVNKILNIFYEEYKSRK